MPTPQALQGQASLLDPDALVDPYPVYRGLLAGPPLPLDPLLGVRLVVRYRDVAAVLESPDFFPSIGGNGIDPRALPAAARAQLVSVEEAMGLWLTYLPPEAHRRRRSLLARAFRAGLVEELRERVAAIAACLLEAGAAGGRLEIVEAVARPLPVMVIAELLGFPAAGRDRLRAWSQSILSFFEIGGGEATGKIAAMASALAAMSDALRALLAERRRAPRADLLSRLLAGDAGGELGEEEIVAVAVQILFAGHETTRNLLANGLLALLRHPGELARLRRERARMGDAVEECLRFESPLQLTSRTARRDTSAAGLPVDAGETLILLLGAANRDPERFAEPDRFAIDRGASGHLAFGIGPHFCLGAALSRLEAEVVFDAVLDRAPHLRLGEEAPSWRPNFAFRGLDRLPLLLAGA